MTQTLAGYRLQGSGRGRLHVQKVYRLANGTDKAWRETTLCSGMDGFTRADIKPLRWDRLRATAQALVVDHHRPESLCPRCVERAPRAKAATA